MLELKSCPFCGGKPEFDHDDNGWNWIECSECHVSSNAGVSAMEDCRPMLAEVWNQRQPNADLAFAYKRAKVLADMTGVPVHESPGVTGTILGLVRGGVERLQDQVINPQHHLEKCRESSGDEEANRWCERLQWLHTEYDADCSGCDSGDTLDLVEVEIRQAIENAQQQAVIGCLEIVENWKPVKGSIVAWATVKHDIAMAIKEKFGLEI